MEFAIEDLAEHGVRWIEPAFIHGYIDFDEEAFSDASASRMLKTFEASNVAALAVSAHFDLGGEEAEPMLRRRITFAAGIGATYLITNAWSHQRSETGLATVARVLPMLEEHAVVLALENPGHGNDNVLGDIADAAATIERLGSPLVRLNYDVANVFTYSREAVQPLDELPGVLPLVAHLHAKDVLAEPSGWRFTALGQGSTRMAEIVATLDALSPDLPVAIELPLRLERLGRGDPVRSAEPVPLEQIRCAVTQSMRLLTGSQATVGDA